jgi:hypothetical protein
MSLRYYPKSKIKPAKSTTGNEFLSGGKPYKGRYYETFDGKFYTGENPVYGKNEPLVRIPTYVDSQYMNSTPMTQNVREKLASVNNLTVAKTVVIPGLVFKGSPTSYFPQPTQSDYDKGYIVRYFTKKINTPGYVIEISSQEYSSIQNGSVPYDVSYWQLQDIFWKLTGPLHQKRISQYDTRAGIVDTNKRLVETANKTFLGITDFIGGEYTKFARPTE